MRPKLFLILALLLACVGPAMAQRGGDTSVRGILVAASSQSGTTDERLRPFEATLRRILRFESFRFLGEGRAALPAAGKTTVLLGQNHRLELQGEETSNNQVRVQVSWLQGNQSLMRTGLVLRPGVPAVLGGPARGDGEVFAVIVVAQ